MTTTICPGQDTRFWQPGDVFEVECAECGYEVEFFKDDSMRRCRRCGARVMNPKLSLGCAQWCEHAEKCLGYDPKKAADIAGGEAGTLTDRLIELVKSRPGGRNEIRRALAVLEWAEEILRHEGGDPKVVLTAALLQFTDKAQAENIMKEVGLDPETMDRVETILAERLTGEEDDTPEFKVVADASALAEIAEERSRNMEVANKNIDGLLKTETAKKTALRLVA